MANEHVQNRVLGQYVHFYVGEKRVEPVFSGKRPLEKCKSVSFTPKWDGQGLDTQKENLPRAPSAEFKNEFLQACSDHETIALDKIRDLFLSKDLKPQISALALKILDELFCKTFEEQSLAGCDALWLLCHLVALCAQVEALDPKFISATKIVVGERNSRGLPDRTLSLTSDTWVNALLTTMPIVEINEAVDVDVLAIAFIKTLAGQFGARGDSTILQVGIGLSSRTCQGFNYIEALWCEARLPESIVERGITNKARLLFNHEVSGFVKASTELPHLCGLLALHGAKSIAWHLVHGEKSHTYYYIKFNCGDDDKREVIEAFLVKGGAESVSVHIAEHHELNRQLASVPMGTGNKTFSVRFYEYIYYDKTVRVEPLQEDLDHYVQKTNYSTDVARSDLLLAWKKWRGRVATESP